MITQNDLRNLFDADVYEQDGDKIGSAGQVYLDNDSGEPEWVTVKTGLFGTKESFVPLRNASLSEGRIVVPFGKDRVKGAPKIDSDGQLSPEEEDELYRYYELNAGTERTDYSAPVAGTRDETTSTTTTTTGGDYDRTATGRADYDRTDDDRTGYDRTDRSDDDAMTRSEERLRAGTRTQEAGRARLRKYVVTEQEQVEVPVRREEVRLEREPITDANRGAATSGPEITESEHEVTLREERPVVETEAVPVERVRLGKETVQDTERVQGEVRKEQIDFDDPQRDRS